MASFKASHPKRHGLTLVRKWGERRSPDVRAHLKGPWRRVVKELTFRLVPVEENEDDDARIARFALGGTGESLCRSALEARMVIASRRKAGANGTAATAMAVPGFSQTLAPDFGRGWIVKKASR